MDQVLGEREAHMDQVPDESEAPRTAQVLDAMEAVLETVVLEEESLGAVGLGDAAVE